MVLHRSLLPFYWYTSCFSPSRFLILVLWSLHLWVLHFTFSAPFPLHLPFPPLPLPPCRLRPGYSAPFPAFLPPRRELHTQLHRDESYRTAASHSTCFAIPSREEFFRTARCAVARSPLRRRPGQASHHLPGHRPLRALVHHARYTDTHVWGIFARFCSYPHVFAPTLQTWPLVQLHLYVHAARDVLAVFHCPLPLRTHHFHTYHPSSPFYFSPHPSHSTSRTPNCIRLGMHCKVLPCGLAATRISVVLYFLPATHTSSTFANNHSAPRARVAFMG